MCAQGKGGQQNLPAPRYTWDVTLFFRNSIRMLSVHFFPQFFLLHCILETSLLSIEVSVNLIMISCDGIQVILNTHSGYIEKIWK